MLDRTIKQLLFAIALALWGLLLRPALTATPVQGTSTASQLAVVNHQGTTTAFVLQNGRLHVYGFVPNTGRTRPQLRFWTARMVDTKP
jgi:hypothetical protein